MKQQLSRKATFARRVVQNGQRGDLEKMIRRKLWSTGRALGLGRDLTVPFEAPEAKIPINVRLIEPDDVRMLLDADEPGISEEERWDRLIRVHLLDAGFSTCYVAATEDGRATYIQWLISSDENDLLESTFRGGFPRLEPNQVLMEGAYTVGDFRGQRIMPAAMAQIADRAAELGAIDALTFVDDDNVPSLKGCKRAGFWPVMERVMAHRLGRRTVTFSQLPSGTPYPFDAPSVGAAD